MAPLILATGDLILWVMNEVTCERIGLRRAAVGLRNPTSIIIHVGSVTTERKDIKTVIFFHHYGDTTYKPEILVKVLREASCLSLHFS